MNGPIRRLAIGLFVAFGALLLSVTWLQVVRADELKLDARNPRPALTVRGKERGIIVTADGTVVARSVQEENSREFIRQYPEGETFAHVVGYSSFLVGADRRSAPPSWPRLRHLPAGRGRSRGWSKR